MNDHRDIPPVEKIEQPILNGAMLGSKLINSILKIVRRGTSQLMSKDFQHSQFG
jgi:hypothetical protein